MSIRNQVFSSINEYPGLFDWGDMKTSVLSVLNQMFIVSGSGYEWVSGERVYKFGEKTDYSYPELTNKARSIYYSLSITDEQYEAMDDIEKDVINSMEREDKKRILKPYPQPYKLIVPDDIRDEYLIAYTYVLDWCKKFSIHPDYGFYFFKSIDKVWLKCVGMMVGRGLDLDTFMENFK